MASLPTRAPVLVEYKIALVIAQVFGYALSKVAGIKVISEMPPQRRAVAILMLIGAAELFLVLFALIPAPWNIACLFANGLSLGMIWGLVFGFLEGRRVSEVLGAMLCASFIVSSGAVKSVGDSVMLQGWANEYWMPARDRADLSRRCLLVCVAGLAVLPPPSAEDERLRVARAPMDGAARRAMFAAFAPGLIALGRHLCRSDRAARFPGQFRRRDLERAGLQEQCRNLHPVRTAGGGIVLVTLALLMFIRDNRRAFLANLVLVAVGLALAGLSSLAFQAHLIGPVAWMIALGAGLYLGYTPFNALLFDRFIAASGRTGTAGFLIYVADACGYLSSVALLVFYNFVGVKISWVEFLVAISYSAAIGGAGPGRRRSGLYFHRRLQRLETRVTDAEP